MTFGSPGTVHQHLVPWVGSVVDGKRQPGRGLHVKAGHEFVHPEGGVHPPNQVRAALTDGRPRPVIRKNRQVHDETRGRFRIFVNNQLHRTSDGRHTRVPCFLHGLPSRSVAPYVYTDRCTVTTNIRFALDNGRVKLSLALWFDSVIGETFASKRSHVRCLLRFCHLRHNPNGLNA